MRHSLQFRLVVRLAIVIVAAGSVSSGLAFAAAYREAHALQDRLLRRIGAMFDPEHLPPPRLATLASAPEGDDADVVRVQLLPAGRGHDEAGFPPGLPDGLQEVGSGAERYRVFVRTLASGQRVAVAQEADLRDEVARAAALRTLVPLLILVPVLLLAVADLVRKTFRPLRQVADEVDRRREYDLHPLRARGLPTEVRAFVTAINRLLRRVAEGVDAQRRFIADAAHELRSPMTALGLQAEALARVELPGDGARRLVDLRGGIDRSRALIEQLLSMARVQSSGPSARAPVSVQGVYRSVIEDLLPLAEARGVDLGVIGEEDVWVSASELDLLAVVKNLAGNAVHHAPRGGRVDLSATTENGAAVLTVEDDGPGIPAEERERVFDPFYRVPGTVGVGSGLGLSIVRTVVERLGGRVSLSESRRTPTGLRVSVILPASATTDARSPHA